MSAQETVTKLPDLTYARGSIVNLLQMTTILKRVYVLGITLSVIA